MARTRVKICCITSPDDAMLAIEAGADALGLVAAMPSGPGVIDDERIREIARAVPPSVATFLLTSRTEAAAIADHARSCEVSTVQIVQHIDPAESERLAGLLGDTVRRVQVIHVEDASALSRARPYEPFVDAFLLDSGRPSLATPEFGGTGRTHDWEVSARFVRALGRPVFLAGGLRADNVATAIARVAPYGVDVCSGVRRDGRLDRDALGALIRAVRR